MQHYTFNYNNVSEFSAGTAEMKTTARPGCWSETGRKSFTGTDNFDAAQALLLSGCLNIVKSFDAKLKDLKKKTAPIQRPRPVCSVVGARANVPAALLGLPLSMIDYKKQPCAGKKKIINIYYNASYNCDVTTEQIINVGSCVLQLSRDLENAGYRTNIFICLKAEQLHYGDALITVKVKTAGERLNLAKLSYCFAHPSFLRRHGFLILENSNFSLWGTHATTLQADDIKDPDGYIINGAEYTRDPENIIKEFRMDGGRK